MFLLALLKEKSLAALACAGLLLAPVIADAAPVTFAGSSGTLAAQVDFEIVSGNLQVTLTNTSTFASLVPADLLTGVFFSIAGNPTLTRISAVLNSADIDPITLGVQGSLVANPPSPATDPGPNGVGGEFAYKAGISGPGGANQGLSSSGLGIFGPGDVFSGANLSGPVDPDGPQYGIISAGSVLSGTAYTGGNPTLDSTPLIKDSVVLTLGGLPVSFSLADISNITFQYGTALTEPEVRGGGENPLPEPSSIALLTVGLGGLLGLRRFRKSR